MAAGQGGVPSEALLSFDWQDRFKREGTWHLSGGAFTRYGLMFAYVRMVDNR